MTCSDCHSYNGASARGPHGAANKYMPSTALRPVSGTPRRSVRGAPRRRSSVQDATRLTHIQAGMRRTGHTTVSVNTAMCDPSRLEAAASSAAGDGHRPYKATGDGNITGFGLGTRPETFNTKSYCSGRMLHWQSPDPDRLLVGGRKLTLQGGAGCTARRPLRLDSSRQLRALRAARPSWQGAL